MKVMGIAYGWSREAAKGVSSEATVCHNRGWSRFVFMRIGKRFSGLTTLRGARYRSRLGGMRYVARLRRVGRLGSLRYDWRGERQALLRLGRWG